jgi:hypothetical protein
MRIRSHMRILFIATMVWIVFLIAGMPDYYLQYSYEAMLLFVLILLIPISTVLVIIFRKIEQPRRLKIALWYAFYFTVPLFIYDSIYCGYILGHGINFIVIFWFLSVYYLIPWILFPLITFFLNRMYK